MQSSRTNALFLVVSFDESLYSLLRISFLFFLNQFLFKVCNDRVGYLIFEIALVGIGIELVK